MTLDNRRLGARRLPQLVRLGGLVAIIGTAIIGCQGTTPATADISKDLPDIAVVDVLTDRLVDLATDSETSDLGVVDSLWDSDPDELGVENPDAKTADDHSPDTPELLDVNGSDGGPDGAPEVNPAPGSWASPIVASPLPFEFTASTANAPSAATQFYTPCAPTTDEGGGEFVFSVSVPNDVAENTTMVATVDDIGGDAVDVDVHILTGLSADSCVARGNTTASLLVTAGAPLHVVVDTWVNASGTPLAGEFTLSLSLQAAPPVPQDCLTNPIPQCTIASVPTPADVPPEPPGVGPCPSGATAIPSTGPPSYCIDRWEGAVALVDGNGVLSPWSPYLTPPTDASLRALSAPGVVPQGHISQIQAAAACAGAGKRLCTDQEWLGACQGTSANTYPYGDTLQVDVCNDTRPCHPVVQYFESGASWVWSELNHPCINQLPDSVHLTGDNPACSTGDGVVDMMGNLHEWTANPAGTFRGGFYKDTVINGPGCLYATTAHSVGHWDYSTGFRCCADILVP